jgi:hypothetical protein
VIESGDFLGKSLSSPLSTADWELDTEIN